MSTVNDFSGNYFLTPDLPAGYGQSISNPASTLSNMVSNGLYYQELPGDQDVILLNVEGYLVSMYKTLSNQRLMQQFVARSTSISSQNKVRWVHRSLALSFSFESALKAIGENVTVSDDWSDLTTINQQLAPLYIQVWSSI
jgi:hypothetical protein